MIVGVKVYDRDVLLGGINFSCDTETTNQSGSVFKISRRYNVDDVLNVCSLKKMKLVQVDLSVA